MCKICTAYISLCHFRGFCFYSDVGFVHSCLSLLCFVTSYHLNNNKNIEPLDNNYDEIIINIYDITNIQLIQKKVVPRKSKI